VDGLSTWVRWIMVGAIGLSPILIVWIALKMGWFMRHNPRARLQSDGSATPTGRHRPARSSGQLPTGHGL
jgi:hypothetical protein